MKNYALIFFLLFSSACSKVDVALNFAPRYIANSIDDAFDLNSDRYKKIKATISQDIEKNKITFIVKVIGYIDDVLLLAEVSDVKTEQVQEAFDKIKSLQKQAIYLFKPTFAEILMPMLKSEADYLFKYSEKKLSKTDERLNDKQKFYKHYVKSYESYMDMLFNSSNEVQDKLFHEFLDINYDYYKYQNEFRKVFLKQFDLLFDKKSQLMDYSMRYYAGDEEIKSEEHLKKQRLFNTSVVELALKIWKNANPEQKVYFKKKLNGIKEELKTIIK